MRKLSAVLVGAFVMLGTCGCIANVFKPALRIGPAVWQEGLLTQDVRAGIDQCVAATEKALEKLNYEITKRTVRDDVTEIMGNYPDGRIIWIDIKMLDKKTSRLEIRVGATGEREPENEVFKKIIFYLRRTAK